MAWPSISLLAACDSKKNEPAVAQLSMQSAWVNDAEFIGYFVGLDADFYKKQGIEFAYIPGGPDIVADTVVWAKKADIALTTPDTTVNGIIKQGAPFKIIGAQFQKNPIGVVSLKRNNISKPSDLIGKSLAVPAANLLTAEAMLKLNHIDRSAVRIVPYQYDPTPLLRGEVDATLDFVTNVPFAIQQRGEEPASFLLYDFGFKTFNDTVVVLEETIRTKRKALVSWLRSSRQGWTENFKDPAVYPRKFEQTYFKGNGRTIDNEIFYNKAQQSLIESPRGIYSMSEDDIAANIESLNAVGLKATREMFVTDLLQEV
jgi:ABC-type nitrate/sulfonate/bicarbonate transport system substrate-binding protein